MMVQFGSRIVCVEIAGYFFYMLDGWPSSSFDDLIFFSQNIRLFVCFLVKLTRNFMQHDEYCLLLCGSKMNLKVSSLPRISYIYVSILLYNYLFPVFS
jgi:hypothetical protein